ARMRAGELYKFLALRRSRSGSVHDRAFELHSAQANRSPFHETGCIGSGAKRASADGPALFDSNQADSFCPMESERILIAGAGGIGSVIGAKLHAAGRRVTLLGRSNHLDAVARDGLRVSGLLGDHLVRGLDLADSASRLEGRYDLILCTVKAYDTTAIADDLRGRLADDRLIVRLQNGLGTIGALADRFSLRRVLGGRVIFGAEIPEPGRTHVTVLADPLAIGPAPAIHGELAPILAPRAAAIAAAIDTAGVPAVACDDIMPIIWTKLLYNSALNPLGALLGLSYGELANDPDLRATMDDTIEEAFAVAQRLEVALPFINASEYRAVFYGRLIPSTATHYPTMLHDLHYRRRTDIDALNGRIVELGDEVQVATPTNRMLVRLIHGATRRAKAR